jgi:DnaK suppressor protein
MARNEALRRIAKSLLNRRQELRKRLGMDLADLNMSGEPGHPGDSASVAFGHSGEELASQLAELEARELAQVEQALLRLKQGKYGICAGCNCKIPLVRLNALPYSTLCIKCQREAENDSNWLESRGQHDWSGVHDSPGYDEPDIDLSEIEIDLSK